MGTFRIYRRLQDLQDVDPNGLPDGGVPAYDTNVSSFVVGVPATVGAFSMGVTDSGNTGGDTGVTGPRVGIVGSGNVTVLQSTDVNGGTITISGSGGAGAGFSAGVSGGNTQGDTGLTGTNLALAGGNNITLSQATDAAGATITISGPNTVAQTVQTQNLFDLTADGNTAGVLALVSSGTLTLAGGQSITLSQNGNAITISGASTSQSVQTQPIQTGISGIIGSNATYTSGTVQFTGSNMVTVRSSAGQRVVIDATQSVQTQNAVDVTLSGNTAGALALVSSGTLTLAGGNNITLSQAGNAVTISGPNVGGAQTGISGIAASDTTYTSGTVTFTGVGGGITVSSNTGQRVDLSVAAQSVQPGIQNLVASDATFSSGTVTISGFGAVTVNTAANLIRISAPVQTAQTGISGIANSQTTYTSGTVSLSELGAITIRSTTGNQFQLSVNAQTGTQFSAGISGGNTAGDTGTVAGRVVLAGGQSITLSGSTNGVSETISIVGASTSQSVQTQGVLSAGVSTGGNTLGNTGVATGSRLVIVGSGMVTASQGTAAGASTITLNATQSAESQSIGMSNIGNTSGTTGIASGAQVRMLFAGVGEVTLSQSLNGASGTLSISSPVQTVESQSIGMSNLGNTAGTTGIASGGQVRFLIVGSNNITLSQSINGASGTLSIIGGAGAGGGSFSGGVSTGGNTAGATGITGTQLVLVGTNAISLSQTTGANGGTVSIDAPATSSLVGSSGVSISTNGSTISVYLPNRTQFYPFNDIPIVTGQQGQATLHIAPLHFPNIQHDRIALGMQISNATNSSNSITVSAWVGLFSRNGSSISRISSTSISTNFTGSGTVGSYSLYGGPKWLTIPWTNTVTEDDYWFGIVIRTTTGGGAGHTVSQLCVSKFTNSAWSGIMGAGSNATDQYQLGLGVFTATTSGIPASIAFTDINGSGSMALREPIFQLRSGTV